MEEYYGLKDKVDRTKEQVASIDAVLHDLRQKAFVTEEILWDLKRNLEAAQRELLTSLKGLSEDEVLAVRSGLSLGEVERGKVLIAELKRPLFQGKAGKAMEEALSTKQEEAKSE